MKTHKTASSTIMNMLFRFGESNNLTFALPAYNASQFFYPFYFNAAYVEGYFRRTFLKFDIMCHHMRFQLGELDVFLQAQPVLRIDTFSPRSQRCDLSRHLTVPNRMTSRTSIASNGTVQIATTQVAAIMKKVPALLFYDFIATCKDFCKTKSQAAIKSEVQIVLKQHNFKATLV
ncbi:hypothetical protein AB205_0007460 [Aquarana catesbeiana]|uniref:Uncharacterized protein n=1 Tax=Aquarana catesbeiana TaxID=8400 RepID=A0A2G9RYD9_AQUCT|nr:hypothetical protein AB205_0007460 [Aquarana catesbeiana]